jgi:hypothetical protein
LRTESHECLCISHRFRPVDLILFVIRSIRSLLHIQAILTLYFVQVLRYSDDQATEAFHLFAMLCYFTPLLGAVIADSFLGNERMRDVA